MQIVSDPTLVKRDQPIRSADGQAIYFFESVSEWRFRAWVFTVIGLVIGLVWGASCWRTGCPEDRGVMLFVGLLYVVILVVPHWLMWLWQQSKPPATKLIVKRDGLCLPTRTAKLIPWQAIRQLSLREVHSRGVRHQVILRLKVADADAYGIRRSGFLRTSERWMFGGDVTVPLEALVGEPADVLAALQEFAPATLARSLYLSK